MPTTEGPELSLVLCRSHRSVEGDEKWHYGHCTGDAVSR